MSLKLLSSLVYPFEHKQFRPAISANGKYVFRMHFNGCYRQVMIDDRLPSSSSSRTLFVVDQRNPMLIWPALMEKAYLKIRGGYDFPGSNSGTDLHVLTGWIPDQLFLQHDDFDHDQAWKMMKKAYNQGNVIATLGTPFLSAEEESTLGLVSEHDYAVMDVQEDELRGRRMLVKNPWRNSVVWKGVGSLASSSSSSPVDIVTSSPSLPSSKASATASDDERTGTFWMPFEDVVRNFDSLYLNWNPAIFTHRQDHHFSWDIPSKTLSNSLVTNPQYSVQSASSSPIWILLSRHWQDGELDILRSRYKGRDATSSQQPRSRPLSLSSVSRTLGFMSLLLYQANPPGTRVSLPDRPALQRGVFVDSPNTLLRLEKPSPGKAYTVVVAQGDLPLPRYSFTLSFFSTAPLIVAPAAEPLPHIVEVQGAWTRRSAGGNTSSPTYHINPQFAVTISRATSSLELLLTTDTNDLPVHVALLYPSSGVGSSSNNAVSVPAPTDAGSSAPQRVTSPPTFRRDLLASSPEYRRGSAWASVTAVLPAGTYTAVVSTFEAQQLGRFALRIASDVEVSVGPMAPDAAGRLRTESAPLPLEGPGDEAENGIRASCAPLQLTRLTRLGLVARCSVIGSVPAGATASPCSSIRASLSLGPPHSPRRSVLAVTGGGEFLDGAAGLRTPEVDGDPERAKADGPLWVVVERIGSNRSSSADAAAPVHSCAYEVRVEILSDAPVSLGPWQVVED
jgi:hypothetical protein